MKYMKSKRFLCTVLACVVMISCITNVAAIQEEVADDFVEYNTESILTTRAIGEFEMTVSAKTKAIADSSLSLEAGDTVRINASYSPDGSVDFGLVDEDGFFHRCGSCCQSKIFDAEPAGGHVQCRIHPSAGYAGDRPGALA